MPTIKVNTRKLASYENDLQRILSRVNSIKSEFSSTSSSLDWDVKASSNINSRLSAINRELSAEARGISGMKNYLDTAQRKYEQVENRNNGKKLDSETTGSKAYSSSVSGKTKTQSTSNSTSNRGGLSKGIAAWTIGATTGTKSSQSAGTNTGTNNNSIKDGVVKYLKKIGKTGLDALGEFGTFGKEAALPLALLKNIIDGDGITGEDIGSTIKGMGNSIIGMCDAYSKEAGNWPLSTADIKELAGLTAYETISTASTKAGWLGRLDNAGTSFVKTIKNEVSPIVKTADGSDMVDSVKTGTKVAGWALSLIANGFSNYDEYSTGSISSGRAVAETVTETVIDIGKGAAIAAGVAAGCAAIGVAAPAVVVGGIGVAVSLVADVVCENITGKSVTEWASDTVLDAATSAGKAITGAAKNAGKAVSGWFKKITSSGNKNFQYAGA